MEQIRFGVAGVVGRGRDFLTPLAANPQPQVVARCNLHEEGFAQLAGQAEVRRTFAEDERMLDEDGSHAVVIAKPLHLHAP